MPVKLKCPSCQTVLTVPDQARGKAVKCSNCGNAIKVPGAKAASPEEAPPAAAARSTTAKGAGSRGNAASPSAGRGNAAPEKRTSRTRPKAAGEDAGDDFLDNFDLNRLEDRNTRVCPRCGTVVAAEDVDCPKCGADLTTGGLGTAQRARKGRKGAAPAEYYQQALKNSLAYVKTRQGLIWKSVLIFWVFLTINFLSRLMGAWCYHGPPKMFWGFFTLITGLVSPGWVMYLQTQFINRLLIPKEENRPFHFEPATCIALGLKSFVWIVIFALPVWLLLGVPAGILIGTGSLATGVILLFVAVLLACLLLAISWPIAQGHFAMPVSSSAWKIHKVLPDVGKNLGPSLYFVLLAFLTTIPTLVPTALGSGFLAIPVLKLQETLQLDAGILHYKELSEAAADIKDANRKAKAEAEIAKAGLTVKDVDELAKQERPEIDWIRLLLVFAMTLPIAIGTAYWAVLNLRSAALFVKLFRANIDLTSTEAEYKYISKSKEERELAESASKESQAVLVTAFLAFALGLAGGMVYATISGSGYAKGLGTGLGAAGALFFIMELIRLFGSLQDRVQRSLRIQGVVLGLVITAIGGGLLWYGNQPEPAAAAANNAADGKGNEPAN